MANTLLQNWMIWPLELINHDLYKRSNRKAEVKAFRRIASRRELEWIKILKSMNPRGFNIIFSKKNYQNRRYKRKSGTIIEDKCYDLPCTSCVEINEVGRVIIHQHSGRNQKLRYLLQRLLTLPDDDTSIYKKSIKSRYIIDKRF